MDKYMARMKPTLKIEMSILILTAKWMKLCGEGLYEFKSELPTSESPQHQRKVHY